jgi:PKD repeat protein
VNNVAPTAEAGPVRTAAEGASVSFTGTFTDPGNDTYTILWDFGDSSTASGTLTPDHTYGDNGTYIVSLVITDDDGGIGTDTLTVTVNNLTPTITMLVSNSPSNGAISLSAAFADKGWLDSYNYL